MMQVEQAEFARGFKGEWHRHRYAQLIYPRRGIMRIATLAGEWVVLPLRACWLPAGVEHRVEAPVGLEMISGYIRGNPLWRLPGGCGIVQVSPLLRELMSAMVEDRPQAEKAAMARVAINEITVAEVPLLFMPQASSTALRRLEAGLKAEPGDKRRLTDWARSVGLGARTMARALERETGMTFSTYRTQIRLSIALQKLAGGESIARVADAVGFHSASSFIVAFRRATGVTPRAYFRGDGAARATSDQARPKSFGPNAAGSNSDRR